MDAGMDYFNELIRSGSFFWFCALAGSAMFFIQFVINLLGVGEQENFDAGDGSQDFADVRNFKWLSMQTLTGFLMVFGWTAITCQNEFGLRDLMTIAISLAAGIAAALILRSILKLAKKLKSSGSIYRIEEAIGQEGYVYQRIPKGGRGKISMSLQNFTHEIDAISHCDEDLPSFIRVKIIENSDANTVVVAPLHTESNSSVGKCQGGIRDLHQAQPASKQSNLNKLLDTGGSKDRDKPTPAEPTLESRAV